MVSGSGGNDYRHSLSFMYCMRPADWEAPWTNLMPLLSPRIIASIDYPYIAIDIAITAVHACYKIKEYIHVHILTYIYTLYADYRFMHCMYILYI